MTKECMTREEALAEIKSDFLVKQMCGDDYSPMLKEALATLVKLSNPEIITEVLNKIKAEIEEYMSTIDYAISEDELKIEGMKEAYTNCIEIIDEIIDKYKVKGSNEQ